KNYVTSNLESSTKVNSAGKHSIISKVFRNRDGNTVSSEVISDLLTSTENTNNSLGKKETTTNKNTISSSTLPITGDNYKMSPIMTILALISLGGLNAFIKKRKS
ncbi:TPA: bifunctional metallophosphatase/5'-nucleotidase, partial [Streptococcus pyogenes]